MFLNSIQICATVDRSILRSVQCHNECCKGTKTNASPNLWRGHVYKEVSNLWFWKLLLCLRYLVFKDAGIHLSSPSIFLSNRRPEGSMIVQSLPAFTLFPRATFGITIFARSTSPLPSPAPLPSSNSRILTKGSL